MSRSSPVAGGAPMATNGSAHWSQTAHEHRQHLHDDRRRYVELSNAPPSPCPARPNALRRSSSVISYRRSSSPALARKSSAASLRDGDAPTSPHNGFSRRPSAHLLHSPTVSARSPLALQMEQEQPPPLTAASVAAEYFRKDLHLHADESAKVDTVVILHDACYGHRYSRPKTSKSALSMIVERPERIHAGILGITSAYVRMGGRHAGGHAAPHPAREPETSIPFRIKRTSRVLPLTSTVVTSVHGSQWMNELKTMCDSAGQKLSTTGKELMRPEPHPKPAGSAAKPRFHEGDLYLCQESLDAFQGALGGVCDGVDAVFDCEKTGKAPTSAFVCVRPPGHHCSADFPSGFCWLNNVHVGIEYATQTYGLTHAAIIDFDLHHGDGSQSITWNHNVKVRRMPQKAPASKKTAIGYFSLHDINSYPCEEGDPEKVQNASLCIENAHGQSIWNVHLQPWKTEMDFWQLYESRYKVLLDKARSFLQMHSQRLRTAANLPPPKAAIFLSAGFDASEWEGQGMQRHKVNVPTQFYARLTADVVKISKEEGLAVGGRIISVLEGGYSDRALTSGVLSHLSGLCQDQFAKVKEEAEDKGRLAQEMGLAMSKLALGTIGVKPAEEEPTTETMPRALYSYDASWWDPSRLAELEALSCPAPPPAQPKKPARPAVAHTYSSPTQSFTAKVVDPSRIRTSSGRHLPSSSPSRAPTPPPPDVDWATAAFELHKLLIPTDRETKSCRPEQLSETRSRKTRQSDVAMAPPPAVNGSRQLRDRKAKVPTYAEGQSDTESVTSRRSVSDNSRRRTIAEFPITPGNENGPTKTRRLSVSSTTSGISTIAPSIAGARKPGMPKAGANGVEVKKTRGRLPSAAAPAPAVPRIPSAHNSDARPQNAPPQTRSTSSKDDEVIDSLIGSMGNVKLEDQAGPLGVRSTSKGLTDHSKGDAMENRGAPLPAKTGPRLKLTNKAAEEADRKKAAAAEKATTKKVAAPKATTGRATKAGPAAKKATKTSKSNASSILQDAEKPAVVVDAASIPVVAPRPEVAISHGSFEQRPRPSVLNLEAAAAATEQTAPVSHPVPSPATVVPPPMGEARPGAAGSNIYPSPPHDPAQAQPPLIPGVVSEVKLPAISPPRPDTPPQPPPRMVPAQPTPNGQSGAQLAAYQPAPHQMHWLPPNSDPAVAAIAGTSSSPSVETQPNSNGALAPQNDARLPHPTPEPERIGASAVPVAMRPNSRGQPMPVFTSDTPIPFAPPIMPKTEQDTTRKVD